MECGRFPLRTVCAAAALAGSIASHAADLSPGGAFVQAGVGKHHVDSATVGVFWPWRWERSFAGGVLSAMTEAYVSYWRAEDFGGGHQSFTQLGVVPLMRYRFAQGRSAWFVEGGIGVSWMDKLYETPERQFSTKGNFVDVLALGRNFGSEGDHELSLRAVHFSNCNIKKPNPGEEFVQLRYSVKF